MKRFEIRRYVPGEEADIWQVVSAATRESNARDYHADLIERWAPADQDMVEWRARTREMNPFVALSDERVVGMAEIEASGFIDYFYVHPRWQARGIGKALLQRLKQEAFKSGATRLFADVSVTAREFFTSQGFIVTEARNKVILGHPAPNFAMEKSL